MAKQLSESKLKELKSNALNILLETRRKLLNNYPFLGSIAMSMDVVPVRDKALITAATDGSSIYFDIDFLSKLSDDEQMFVFAHEIWHAALCHMIRKESRDSMTFNIAADLEVNQLLVADGLTPIKDCILPETLANKIKLPKNESAENYYELLQKLADKQANNNSNGNNSNRMSSNGSSSSNSNSKCKNSNQNNPKQLTDKQANNNSSGNNSNRMSSNGSSSSNSNSKCKNSNQNNPKQIDKHIYKDDIADESSNEKRIDRYGEVGKDPDFVPNVKPNIDSEMKSTVSMAAQQYERQRGELPNHIKSIIKKLLTPKVNWKEALQKFITKSIDNKVNWNIPNRRFIYGGTYLPSHSGDIIKLGVIIDTSGSTSDDMIQFISELNAIVSCFNNYELTVCQCDTEVKSIKTYDQYNALKHEDIEIEGGGGTYLTPAFETIQAQNNLGEHEIDGLIVFTDGYIEKIDKNICNIPVLWVISKDGNESECTFGDVIKMDNK